MSTLNIMAVKFGAVHQRSIPNGSRTTTGDPARVLKGDFMKKRILALTDESAEIIKTWTICETSGKDCDARPDCDFCVNGELNSAVKGLFLVSLWCGIPNDC